MKINVRCLLFLIAIFISNVISGQIQHYQYVRELEKVKDQWNAIILPDDIFGKIKSDFSDIRIYGVSENSDTSEVPYSLDKGYTMIEKVEIPFKVINQTINIKGYYYTFEVPTSDYINEIRMDFTSNNFDFTLKLEGSENQKEWFTITDNYRLLSIKNKEVDFKYTSLSFPEVKYGFFRVLIKSKTDPGFKRAVISRQLSGKINYRDYKDYSLYSKDEKTSKQTMVYIDLKKTLPVSGIKMDVNFKGDYYRPITIQYLSDSFKTPQGWEYTYSTLSHEILTSVKENKFQFQSTLLRKLKVIIDNKDNEVLNVKGGICFGGVFRLLARFNHPEMNYYLCYGNPQIQLPAYDIEQFSDKIPSTLNNLSLKEEKVFLHKEQKHGEALFKNKLWLWLLMAGIILVLGWFSFKMLGKANN